MTFVGRVIGAGMRVYPCGCSVSVCMFGNGVCGIGTCSDHEYIYSPEKPLHQMATEIREATPSWVTPAHWEASP